MLQRIRAGAQSLQCPSDEAAVAVRGRPANRRRFVRGVEDVQGGEKRRRV